MLHFKSPLQKYRSSLLLIKLKGLSFNKVCNNKKFQQDSEVAPKKNKSKRDGEK